MTLQNKIFVVIYPQDNSLQQHKVGGANEAITHCCTRLGERDWKE